MRRLTMSGYEAHLSSEAYVAGKTCDGYPYTAECYLVCAENADGRRFEHVARFPGCRVEEVEIDDGDYCDTFTSFEDIREEAAAKASALVDRINAHLARGGELDMNHWVEVDPAYGSVEYQRQGIEEQRAFADSCEEWAA
jgi:hypothetical protein